MKKSDELFEESPSLVLVIMSSQVQQDRNLATHTNN